MENGDNGRLWFTKPPPLTREPFSNKVVEMTIGQGGGELSHPPPTSKLQGMDLGYNTHPCQPKLQMIFLLDNC